MIFCAAKIRQLAIVCLCFIIIGSTNKLFAQLGGANLSDSTFVASTFDQRPWLFSLPYKHPTTKPIPSIDPNLLATLQPKIDPKLIWNFERKSRVKHYDPRAPLSGRLTNRSPIGFALQIAGKMLNNFIHPTQKQPLFNTPQIKWWQFKRQ